MISAETYNHDYEVALKKGYEDGYKKGRLDAIDELVSEVDKAITEMENNSKIEKTLHNACIVGAIIGTMKRIAKELKEKNNG